MIGSSNMGSTFWVCFLGVVLLAVVLQQQAAVAVNAGATSRLFEALESIQDRGRRAPLMRDDVEEDDDDHDSKKSTRSLSVYVNNNKGGNDSQQTKNSGNDAYEGDSSEYEKNGEGSPQTQHQRIVLERIEKTRILILLVGMASSTSISRMKKQLSTWGGMENLDFVIVASNLQHSDLGLKPSPRVKFMALESDVGDKDKLFLKIHDMWVKVWEEYGEEYDFFFKIDDDTFVNPYSLTSMLAHIRPDVPAYLGRKVGMSKCRICKELISPTFMYPFSIGLFSFHHGGAGYVISRSLLDLLGPKLKVGECLGFNKKWEDAIFSMCIALVADLRYIPQTIEFNPMENDAKKNQTASSNKFYKYKETKDESGLPSPLVHLTYHTVYEELGDEMWSFLSSQLRGKDWRVVLGQYWETMLGESDSHVVRWKCGEQLFCTAPLSIQLPQRPLIQLLSSPPSPSLPFATPLVSASAMVWEKLQSSKVYSVNRTVKEKRKVASRFQQIVVICASKVVSYEEVVNHLDQRNIRFSLVVVMFDRGLNVGDGRFLDDIVSGDGSRAHGLVVLQAQKETVRDPSIIDLSKDLPMETLRFLRRNRQGHSNANPLFYQLYELLDNLQTTGVIGENSHVLHVDMTDETLRNFRVSPKLFSNKLVEWHKLGLVAWLPSFQPPLCLPQVFKQSDNKQLEGVALGFAVGQVGVYRHYLFARMQFPREFESCENPVLFKLHSTIGFFLTFDAIYFADPFGQHILLSPT
eukprot:m.159629 g.159629  ORF g.159629 m.159629 type:complete len:749 (+) comp13374_c0_seq2:1818-4064(+)